MLNSGASLLTVTLLAQAAAAETVLGAYIFSRHGDRTSKSTPPTVLTDLGYSQVYSSGKYYRNRYISSSSSSQVLGISPDIIAPGEITASAPQDEVLQKSALAFFQGLYPPAGKEAKTTLRNGTVVEAPMDGYQLIAIEQVQSGSNSENVAWLQSASACQNAKISSNNYFISNEYKGLLKSTEGFYKSLTPKLNQIFPADKINYKNAYAIFDVLNVASIHNASDSSPPTKLLEDNVYSELLSLANVHEYSLAFNASDSIRAVSGSLLAGEVLNSFMDTIKSHKTKPKVNVQFGAYATFLSFFGLSKLSAVNNDFNGIPDYASTMAFELVTNASTSSSDSFPAESDISVRFLFHNGTTIPGSADTEPTVYPLFGQEKTLLPWSDFVSHMKEIAITSQDDWCKACGSASEGCPDAHNGGSSGPSTSAKSDSGISRPVAGVIGAMVTLAVVLGVQAIVFFVGGFTVARKSKRASSVDEMTKGSV
ncbi:putative acid phosphatase [Microsporum audouinii]